MNRKLLLCLTLMFLVGLCACASKDSSITTGELSDLIVNDFAGASMEIKEGTVTPKGLTLEFNCMNKNECIYGDAYSLEVYQENTWHLLDDIVEDRILWNAIGHILHNGETSECSVDWTSIYGELGDGHYRIIKSISNFREAGDSDKYYLAAEFTITTS